jgi:DNA-binding transcriptional LysR family regulator
MTWSLDYSSIDSSSGCRFSYLSPGLEHNPTQKTARASLDYHLIYEESFWLVAPPQIVVPTSQEVLHANPHSLEEWLRTQAWLAYSEELPIIRRFWRVVFGRRIDVKPTLILPDLRGIRSAIAAGFGFSVLPDYLCDGTQLQIILKPENLKPEKAVKNQIWLVYRKSEQREQVLQIRSLFS